jgi:hypothetical protein
MGSLCMLALPLLYRQLGPVRTNTDEADLKRSMQIRSHFHVSRNGFFAARNT